MARHYADAESASPSQRLVEMAMAGEAEAVAELLAGGGGVDVNYVGAVSLRAKCTEEVCGEEAADEVRVEYRDLRTDVSALFAAAHSGHADVVRRLLSAGSDVNQEFFRGYATTAAAREGHCTILGMLLKAGASQSACEDALLEASLYGEAEAVQLLICSDMPRPDVAAHALVIASSRGFVDVATTLIENGVDINSMDRILLRSVKPTLHANVDCTPLVAAIVSRQVSVVKYLLEAGATTDCQVRVGAWSWDPISGEELRVGACLGEPYNAAWCAVEYYEVSGEILFALLRHNPSLLEDPHLGRTLLCHAILCQNPNAVQLLLDVGANFRFPIITKSGNVSHPIHLAARLGGIHILGQLISHGCDVNTRTSDGETPLMISARADNSDCFLELIKVGGDLGLVSNSGDSAIQLAKRSSFASSIASILSQALVSGASICSTDLSVFSPLHFIAESGNAESLQMILHSSTENINKLDGSGMTPVMLAARAGQADAFRLLVMAGADVTMKTPDGDTVMSVLAQEGPAALKDSFQQILLDAVLAYVLTDHEPFRALHYAAQKGDTSSIIQLLKMGFLVDALDDDGYSPLMLAAMEGHTDVCKILLYQGGADCGAINDRKETALSLARKSNSPNKATEGVLLDHLARSHVLAGEELYKHIREGRGTPHLKTVRMLKSGVLTWGKTRRRNVACKEAAAGPSLSFLKNRRKECEGGKSATFRIVSVTGRVVHFEANCPSGLELWVRGINLVAEEAAAASSVA
ncbi:putative ankyrin-3 [Iris pallida]|uniref:Ankyrin-3 n=1 Tax=Iris pallida TaxID=29817 RepID=A0AAX6GK74_IRIPA|nr:putative ankyrin-3 [Iris pallida]